MNEPVQLNLLDQLDDPAEAVDYDDGSWEWWWENVAVPEVQAERRAA